MAREAWIVEFDVDMWYSCGPEYISEEVAKLAIKYFWGVYGSRPLRVRRVA